MSHRFSPRTNRAGAIALLLVAFTPQRAAAEATSAQRATAEALFQQASQLMEEKRYGEACEKFAASQELDAGLGTMLYLADCYDQAGRTASAWALFREAEDSAQRSGQLDRKQIAAERAQNLEGRLSRLELRVPSARHVSGLELRVNDAPVPSASWNVPLPMDPGSTRIEARAPGKKPWSIELKIAEGPVNQVAEIPKLSDAPRPTPISKVQPGAPVSTHSAQRAVGYITGAFGVAALLAGGFFGYRAYSLNRQSKADCRASDPNACTSQGASLRESAQTAASLSTITSVSGGLLVVGGLTLLVTAPPSPSTRADERGRAQAASPAFGLGLRGVW